MQLPFTAEQFFATFNLYNSTVWPAQVFLVLLAVLAIVFIALRRSWSGVAVSVQTSCRTLAIGKCAVMSQ